MNCKKCGGTMYGDGYTTVLACEYAEESQTEYVEPDAGPIYCSFTDDMQPEEQL